MYSVETAIEKFKSILTAKDSWATLQDSQFVEHLATFVGWAIRQAQWATERVKQEFFLSSALNRSSIVAHAESNNYQPRKPIASSGLITITNNGENSVSIPVHTEFSTENEVPVVTLDAVVLAPGETKHVSAEQKQATSYSFTVESETPFPEFLLPAENSASIAGFSVYVDIQDGTGFQEWKQSRLLQNSYATSKVYDESYSHTDQIRIRFGNGNFGLIPPKDSSVRVDAWETQGNVYLAAGQGLFLVSSVYDSSRNPAVLESIVSGSFTGGSAAEGTEETRNNLRYYPTYDETLVWSEDYSFFLKRRFPEILFSQAWGEQQAEEMAGAPSFDFINKIFVCVYADRNDTQSVCIEALQSVNLLNRVFEWVEPVHINFTVAFTGKVLPDVILTDAEDAVRDVLNKYYGKDSSDRREKVYLSEVYEAIQDTGYFEKATGARFEVALAGSYEASKLYEMVSIDLDNSTFTLEYL